jgi:acetyl-CoA acetyltransferase
MPTIKDKAAIVGIGVTDFSKDSKRTQIHLACECILAAIKDAGLKVEDIDGMVKHTNDAADEQRILRSIGGRNLNYYGECRWGSGGSSALVLRATMGVAAGVANNVVVYWTANDSSKRAELPYHVGMFMLSTSEAEQFSFYPPVGLITPEGQIGLIIRRYMHEFGIKDNQFGWVPVVCRENAAKNPGAIFYKQPITIEDYLKSDMIVEPIRALDCHTKIDGAVALVVTTAERAKNLKQKPVYIMAAAQSAVQGVELMTSYNRPVISGLPETSNVGKELFRVAGVTPKDINVVQLDDSYAPLVPMQLEELGFCKRGEGPAFCDKGSRIRVGGELPLNTSGGSLGEGYLYCMNHIVEAVRQVRGTAINQVKNVELALVSGGAGGPASGLILRR